MGLASFNLQRARAEAARSASIPAGAGEGAPLEEIVAPTPTPGEDGAAEAPASPPKRRGRPPKYPREA